MIDKEAFLMEPFADPVLFERLTTIRKYAFDETNVTSVYIFSAVTVIALDAFSWSTLPCFKAAEKILIIRLLITC